MFRNPLFLTPKPLFLPQKQGLLNPKTGVFDLNLFPNYFREFEKTEISKKFPNFDYRTIPKLTKTKSSENSVFHKALIIIRLV